MNKMRYKLNGIIISVFVVVFLSAISNDVLAETDEELKQLINQYEDADKDIEELKKFNGKYNEKQIKQKEIEKLEYLTMLNKNNIVTKEQFDADRNGKNISIPAKDLRFNDSIHKDNESNSNLMISHLNSNSKYQIQLMSHCCNPPTPTLSFNTDYAYQWFLDWTRYITDFNIRNLTTQDRSGESETIMQSDYDDKVIYPYSIYTLKNANIAKFIMQYGGYDASNQMINSSWDVRGNTTNQSTYWHPPIAAGLAEEGGYVQVGTTLNEIS